RYCGIRLGEWHATSNSDAIASQACGFEKGPVSSFHRRNRKAVDRQQWNGTSAPRLAEHARYAARGGVLNDCRENRATNDRFRDSCSSRVVPIHRMTFEANYFETLEQFLKMPAGEPVQPRQHVTRSIKRASRLGLKIGSEDRVFRENRINCSY